MVTLVIAIISYVVQWYGTMQTLNTYNNMFSANTTQCTNTVQRTKQIFVSQCTNTMQKTMQTLVSQIKF